MSDELGEIWTLYADDGAQSLDTVEEVLQRLDDAPNDANAVAALFRAVHTFKGNARVLGLSVIESRAHTAEDLIGLVRDEGVPLDSEIRSLLLEASDALRAMLEESAAHRRDVDAESTDDLVQRMRDKLSRCRNGEGPIEAELEPVPATEPDPSPDIGLGTIEEPEPPLEPETDDEELGAIVFDQSSRRAITVDPLYREIYSGMALEVIGEFRQALDAFDESPEKSRGTFADAAGRLRYAGEQISMPEWSGLLAEFLEHAEPSADQANALLRRMEELFARDFGALNATEEETAAPEPHGTETDDGICLFFNDLEPLLSVVTSIGRRMSSGEGITSEEFRQVADGIGARAESLGFTRVAEAAFRLATERDPREYGRMELQLYEELASIETAMPERVQDSRIHPVTLLRTLCADRIFDILFEVANHLDLIRKRDDARGQCDRLVGRMGQISHACRHYGLDTAAQLATAFADLFSRIYARELDPDPILLNVSRSFTTTLERVFNTVNSGHAPDAAAMEKLLDDTANVVFAADGAMSSSSVEARLGLPKSFHKVLTPESVRSAAAALAEGRRFYIVRADINRDEAIASRFLEWISTGIATAISNVTVFAGDVTLFDFLLATPLDETQLAEAMAVLDPERNVLKVEAVLTDRRLANDGAQSTNERTTANRGTTGQDTITGDMLEAIGEAVAGQAMIHHMLSSLADEDLLRIVESEVRDAGNDWKKARGAVHRVLEDLTGRIEKALQVGAQLNTHLGRLQEEAIAVRMRSAALLLKPLEAFAETTARQHGRQIAVSCMGEDLVLDHTMLESLKDPLRKLVSFCVTQSIETPEDRVATGKDDRGHIQISLVRQDDHIAVTVEDDGNGGTNGERECADVQTGLKGRGGSLRTAPLPTGGTRFHVTLPMVMVVLDGMVVRVGEVFYVVPLDVIQRIVHFASDGILRVSADRGRYMLKLGKEDIVPIQFLQSGDANVDSLAAAEDGAKRLFIVIGKQSRRIALSVDELVGQQVVLVRPLQGYLAGIQSAKGCALLGGGNVGMVLDTRHVLSTAN